MIKQKIAIIGAGMTGLAAAYYLSKSKKYQVHLFEKNEKPGGLLGILEINGVGIEGYYHHLFKCDKEIISLAKELNIEDKLLYLPSKIGIFYDKKIYPFSTPADLLKFYPLSPIDRVRLGLVAVYLQKIITEKNWKNLRRVPASTWMRKYAGEKSYKIIWEPLLRGKFGNYADKISMAWLWSRLYLRGKSRGRHGKEEELVYFDGGFKVLVDKMVEEIKNNGGKIYTNTPIYKITKTKSRLALKYGNMKSQNFYKIIVTLPNPIFVKIAPELPKKIKNKLLKVKYRGAMAAVFQLKKQFIQDIYWLNINDRSMNILAVVEHTNFVTPRIYGGKHILYAGNYPAQDGKIISMDKQKLVNLLIRKLKLINPAFDKSWIEKVWVFRDKYAQPIVTTDYYKYIPPVDTGIPNLYLVNMAQVYPEDRGTNQAVRDGKRIAEEIIANKKNAAA